MNQREAFRETLRLAIASAIPEGDVTDPTSLAHMREMYKQIQEHEFSDAKLGRWLGWAQCALVSADVGVSLDDVKAINRRHADVQVAPIGPLSEATNRFLDVVEQMWEGPLDHFTCTEVEALADLMAAARGEEAARGVICHHFYDSDEEEGELFAHLQKWPGLESDIRRTFSSDCEIIEQLDEVERLQKEGAL